VLGFEYFQSIFSKFDLGFEFLTFKREKEHLKSYFSCNKNGNNKINSGH